jgi:hypothetical protein
MRRLLLLLLVAAAVYWIVRDRPTVASFIDRLTSPLFSSKAALDESENKRIVAEAAPAVGGDQEVAIGRLKEGMDSKEVRRMMGAPDSVTEIDRHRERWEYRRVGRTLLLVDHRIVSIEVR